MGAPLLEPASKLHGALAKLQLRRRLPDVVGILVAAAYGAPSLTYAFGRDQAIFHYMGREWLDGRIPYRDAFDLKPPAIYLLHSLSVALFGRNVHAIRFMELLGVLGIGWLAALAVQREAPRRRGEVGLCAMLSVSWYYSTLDFWDTGQSELWEGLFLLAAYVAILRIPKVLTAAAVAGVLASTAIMFKLTAGLVAVVLALPVAHRAFMAAAPEPKARASAIVRALGAYAAGGVSVFALVFAYYAAHGALPYLEELLAYIRSYARSGWNPPNPGQMTMDYWLRSALWLVAFVFAWAIAAAESASRRSWKVLAGAGMAFLLLLAAVATVAAQRKFFNYHWGVVAPFLTLFGAYGVAECARDRPIAAHLATAGFLIASFLESPPSQTAWAKTYRIYTLDYFLPFVRGELEYDALMRAFVANQNYNWSAQMDIAQTIRERMKPGDLLHVRGFELGIYAMTGLHSPSRFVSEMPLDEPALQFNHEAWLKEHDDALWNARPRFFVGFVDRLEDDAFIMSHGYHEIRRSGLFLLMERNEP